MNASSTAGALHAPGQMRDGIAAVLARGNGSGASSEEVAASIAATYRDIEGALSPIIGARGVAALGNRSLHVARQSYPWLTGLEAGSQATMDVDSLTSLISQQTPSDAAAAGGLLLQTFHELLASLIGESLTERLLRSVWAPFLTGIARDIRP